MKKIMNKFFIECVLVAACGFMHSDLIAQNALPSLNMQKAEAFPLFDLDYCHHPVTTKSALAEQYFNQGLAFLYAFNQDAAEKSFSRAVEEDGEFAMGYWGLAMALGPILDIYVTEENQKKAYAYIQKAQELASHVTTSEQAYIQATTARFTNIANPDYKQLAHNYKNALKKVHDEYPDDIDVAALYAESALCLISTLWDANGEPNNDTLDVVTALESALKKDPNHIGLNHFYIHLIEDSKYPERAWPSADRLAKINPVLSHLVHSASHIYMLVGDYKAAIAVNEVSITAAENYLTKFSDNTPPIQSLSHNLLFLVRSYVMAGQVENAKKTAIKLRDLYSPHYKKFPYMEFDYSVLQFVLIHFNQWSEVLQQPQPPSEMKTSLTIWHFSQTMVYLSLNDLNRAEQAYRLFEKSLSALGNDDWKDCANFLTFILQAKVAQGKQDFKQAVQHYQKALTIQENNSGESFPFNWLLFVSENLGGCLLKNQQYKEAESVFRIALNKHARNGRALFGLLESLKGQQRLDDAFWVKEAFNRAWAGSDSLLTIESL